MRVADCHYGEDAIFHCESLEHVESMSRLIFVQWGKCSENCEYVRRMYAMKSDGFYHIPSILNFGPMR
jgi:hypothetical protein